MKDAIESCGVPHPEVDLILVDGKSVDFSYQLEVEIKIDIFSVDKIIAVVTFVTASDASRARRKESRSP